VSFLEFMFVPMILLLTVVSPVWITLHYRSLNKSSRALSDDDRHALEEMLESVDRMSDRINNLEAILDADHPNWRNDKES
jgi:phage shock protein B